MDRTLIHVAMLVENETGTVLAPALNDARLDTVTTDDRLVQDVRPLGMPPILAVPAGGQRRIDVYFALPAGIAPDEVEKFRFRWNLALADRSISETTPFIERPELAATPPYAGGPFYFTPYYDPFLADPFYDPAFDVAAGPFVTPVF